MSPEYIKCSLNNIFWDAPVVGANLSNRCWDFSVWIDVVDKTSIVCILRATRLKLSLQTVTGVQKRWIIKCYFSTASSAVAFTPSQQPECHQRVPEGLLSRFLSSVPSFGSIRAALSHAKRRWARPLAAAPSVVRHTGGSVRCRAVRMHGSSCSMNRVSVKAQSIASFHQQNQRDM